MVSGVGPARVRKLLAGFGSLGAAWQASRAALLAAGLDGAATDALLQTRARVDLAATLAALRAAGTEFIPANSDRYPERLREIDYAPLGLYVRGELLPSDDLAVAIVGTRRISAYGRQVTERLATELAASGVTIVSGLARGVDTVAHQAAAPSPCWAPAPTSCTRRRTGR